MNRMQENLKKAGCQNLKNFLKNNLVISDNQTGTPGTFGISDHVDDVPPYHREIGKDRDLMAVLNQVMFDFWYQDE